MNFKVDVLREGKWVETPVGVERGNHYVRTAKVVAVPMNEKFRVMSDDGPKGPAPRLLGTGESGDYLVLDNGFPRADDGYNFRATHVQIPTETDDEIKALKVTIERIITQRVTFEDDLEVIDLVDSIFGAIATMGVQP